MNKIIAYTDGSATTKNEKLGGFGVYIIDGQKEYFYRQGFSNTKTGRMELKAMIHCLQSIKDKTRRIEIHSDSEYVVKCITERRLWKWKRNLWVGIKNIELIIQYYEEYIKFFIPPKVQHIKGHTGFEDSDSLGNQIVDELANYKTQTSYERDIV